METEKRNKMTRCGEHFCGILNWSSSTDPITSTKTTRNWEAAGIYKNFVWQKLLKAGMEANTAKPKESNSNIYGRRDFFKKMYSRDTGDEWPWYTIDPLNVFCRMIINSNI